MSSRFLNNAQMLFAILIAGFATTSAAAPTPSLEDKLPPYLTPQHAVPIERGRAINIVCLGQGSPTVVITPGLGHWSWWWWNVQMPLSERTRVCAWDRAGWGFSSPSPEPQDTVHTTADLERTLKKAGIEGPYVMVGHSRHNIIVEQPGVVVSAIGEVLDEAQAAR